MQLTASDATDAASLNSSDESIFATRVWFSHWLAAFGNSEAGIWQPSTSTDDLRIAWLMDSVQIGPFKVRIARAAANSHSPRFDACGKTLPTAAHLNQMMSGLRVSTLVFPLVSWQGRLARAVAYGANQVAWFRDHCESAPYVDCTGDWNDYLAGRGKSHRSNCLADERRAIRAGGRFRVLLTWDDVSAIFDELLLVEASGWKGRGGTAISQSTATRGFYEGLCKEFATLGNLRVFLYLREDKIAAFHICLLHAGTMTSLKIGYRQEFAKESPGQVLRLWVLQWCFAQTDVRVFDMLGPSSENKLRWATGVEDLYTIYVFESSLRGWAARARWQFAPGLKASFRRLLAGGNARPSKSAVSPERTTV